MATSKEPLQYGNPDSHLAVSAQLLSNLELFFPLKGTAYMNAAGHCNTWDER